MRFNHILFPIDFSEWSAALNRQVEQLAAQFGSRVTLLYVFEIPAAWYVAGEATFVDADCLNELRRSARLRLNEYSLKVPDERLERVIAEGDAAAEILNLVGQTDVDLIVMGTHGYGAFQGWILGSVTAKVLHRARCPILTASPRHAQLNNFAVLQILCAVEMIDEAIPLLRSTKELARNLGATVRIVHSVPETESRPNRYFDFDLHRYLLESAQVELAKMQREASTEFPVTVSGRGIPGALAEAANEHGAGLIVIGRGKAQTALGRFQTHVYEIIRDAPCPVLSYSLSPRDRTSLSCNAEHLSQCAKGAQPLTGSQKL